MITHPEMHANRRQLDRILDQYITLGSYVDSFSVNGKPLYHEGNRCCRYSAYVACEQQALSLANELTDTIKTTNMAGRAVVNHWPQTTGKYAGLNKVEVKFW